MLDLSAVPRLRSGVLFESTPEQDYLYDSDAHTYALLDNEVAVEIIRLCDGSNSVGAICARLAFIYEASLERIQEDVLGLLKILKKESFVQYDAGDAEKS